jgi:pseudaminic acid cytidylyltransferase
VNIAVIPARGGSKRIPHKNIRNFCGKPLLGWSIEIAKSTGLFDHIIVSTDDMNVAQIAKDYKAEVPFMRPAALSDDYTSTTSVISHATQWALNQDWPVTSVCCIYATAPFIQVEDLKQGLEALKSGHWAYVFTATQYRYPIFRSFRQFLEGGVEMFFPDQFEKRSQDLPIAYHDAGQFYWGTTDAWIHEKRLFEKHSMPLIIPSWRVQDIDSEEDWCRAEFIHEILRRRRFELPHGKR